MNNIAMSKIHHDKPRISIANAEAYAKNYLAAINSVKRKETIDKSLFTFFKRNKQ